MRIKICGLRSEGDVAACLVAGVDMVGFNFWPQSKRFVAVEQAAALIARLPPEVVPVGVFVSAPPAEVARTVARSGVRRVQLHGDEDPSKYLSVGAELIQVLRIDGEGSLPAAPPIEAVKYVLVDAKVEGFGGAGKTFDWSLARRVAERVQRPVLLAGGLTPANVAEAIRAAQPWAVDVASGVESAPGVKDPEKVAAFAANARAAGGEW